MPSPSPRRNSLKRRNYPQDHVSRFNYVVPKIEDAPPVYEGPAIRERLLDMTSLKNYQDLIETRELDVEGTRNTEIHLDGEDKWTWIKADQGAWDGPHRDWQQNHSKLYFKYVKNYDVVITAGGNQGMYVRFYAKRFGTVYAFEPDPLNFHCLVMNNQVDNVIKMNCALGEYNGFCQVERTCMENTGTFKVIAEPPEAPGIPQMRVPVLSLDSMNFKMLDLLQLDVEGYEINVLKGARNTIVRCKPVIIAENGKTNDIRQFMASIDYEDKEQSSADTIWVAKGTVA